MWLNSIPSPTHGNDPVGGSRDRIIPFTGVECERVLKEDIYICGCFNFIDFYTMNVLNLVGLLANPLYVFWRNVLCRGDCGQESSYLLKVFVHHLPSSSSELQNGNGYVVLIHFSID